MKKHFDEGILRGQISSGVDYYKGEPGKDGEDGFSPLITVEEIENGHRIIITDKNGVKSFDILDGQDGQDGEDRSKDIITRNAEISFNGTRWTTIQQPDFSDITDFMYARVSLKATHNELTNPYSTYLTLHPNKPGTAFCGYYDGGIYTLTRIGSNWQGGCVDLYKINNKANEVDIVRGEIGELYELLTEDTSSIVNAINEVQHLAMTNHYTLPTATTSTLGGVKIDGSTITINNGVISATSSGGGSGVSYTAGTGINIDSNVISADTSILAVKSELPEAQVNSDWNATTGISAILNKPSIPSYTAGWGIVIENDEIEVDQTSLGEEYASVDALASVEASIPTNVSDLTNDAGYITSADVPVDVPTYVAGRGIEIFEDEENTINVALGDGLTEDLANAIAVDAGDGLTFDGSQLAVDFNTVASTTYVASAINAIPTYTLPTATTSVLGGVKVDGSTITISNGVISSSGSSWDLSDRLLAGTSGTGSICEGDITQNRATGDYSHAEGILTQATGSYSHAEGWQSKAWGNSSHAEGSNNKAGSVASHAEGYSTYAQGDYCHAEGMSTTANGVASHAEGNGTITSSSYQHAEGMFNVEDNKGVFQNIAGNGADKNNRSNSFARDWSGNEYLAGNLYVGCNAYSTTSGGLITANAGGSKVATESYVNTAISSATATGASYTAGTGIVISNNVISTSSNVAMKMMVEEDEQDNSYYKTTDLTTPAEITLERINYVDDGEGGMRETEDFHTTYSSNGVDIQEYDSGNQCVLGLSSGSPELYLYHTENDENDNPLTFSSTISTQEITITENDSSSTLTKDGLVINQELSEEVKTGTLYSNGVGFVVDNQEDEYQPYEGWYGSGGLNITMREPTEDFDQTGEVYETFISITPEQIEFNSDVNRVNGQLAIGASGDLEWNGEPILPSAPSTGTYMLTSTSGTMSWTAITVGGNY